MSDPTTQLCSYYIGNADSSWECVYERGHAGPHSFESSDQKLLLAEVQTLRALVRQFEAALVAPPAEAKQGGCISCGERNDGGYMVEDGPGPFCSQCWEQLRVELSAPAVPGLREQVEKLAILDNDNYADGL